MRPENATLAILTALLVSAVPSPARSATLTVPGDFPTIQGALDAASTGDTVVVAAGEFFELVTVPAGVALVGNGMDDTVIDGGGTGNETGSVVTVGAGAVVSDLTVRNANAHPVNNLGACIEAKFVANALITRTRLTNCRIGVASIGSVNVRITRSLIIGSTAFGVVVSGQGAVIENNTVVDNGRGIQDNSSAGTGDTTVRNNIVVSNQTGIYGAAGTFRFNDVFDNVTNYEFMQDRTGIDGNISVDPLFVDEGGGIYELLPGSPAIDAGDPLGPTDPDESIADLGAFPIGEIRPSYGTFIDVPVDHWAYEYIETLADTRVTSGCGGGGYCPDNAVTRAQMAVFLVRSKRGSDFLPPSASGETFLDVASQDFAASFVEELYRSGITSGCGGGNFCSSDVVTRAQMAVFLLRAKYGRDYAPPAATGEFGDVGTDYWAAAWIEQLAAEGITSGCGGGAFCPEDPVTRAQMAVFLVRAELDRAFYLSPTSLQLAALGEAAQVDVPASDPNGNPLTNDFVTWSSSDEDVVTVSASGLVTSRGNGTATITATLHEGVAGYLEVTVQQVAATLDIAPGFVTLESIGQSQQYQAIVLDANGYDIEPSSIAWGVSNVLVAEASASGLVIATGFGMADVSVTAESLVTTVPVRVSFGPPMSLLPEDWSMPVNDSIGFVARLSESGEPDVLWSVNGIPSGDATVGTIDAAGVYRSPSAIPVSETVTVRATLADDPGTFVESQITVTEPAGTAHLAESLWTPRVLDYGAVEEATYELTMSGDPLPVDFDRPTPECPAFCSGVQGVPLVPVRTGVYALRFASTEILADYSTGDLHHFVGSIECSTCDPAGTVVLFPNVRDTTVPSAPVSMFAANIQASSHLVNIRVGDFQNWASGMPEFYALFPDMFDFVSVIYPMSMFQNRHYVRHRNQTTGLGLTFFDQGGPARLQGVVVFPVDSLFDGASRTMSHEIGHRWAAYLTGPEPIDDPAGAHWPVSDLANGVTGYGYGGWPWDRGLVQVSGDTYQVTSETSTGEFNDLELNLMGLIGPDEVSPHVFVTDPDAQWWQTGTLVETQTISIEEIIAVNGARVPDHLSAQRDFTMATIIYSEGRFLTDVEMSFFNHMAQRAEATTELWTTESFRKVFDKPFFLATGGRATLSSRVLP